MPFKSEAQRRLLWARYPRLARRWADRYGTPKDLPMRVGEDGDRGKEAAQSTEGEMTHDEKVIDAFQLASAALEKAEKADREKTAQDNQVLALIPEAVDALLQNDRIDVTEKAALAEALKDPVKTIRILIKTAAHRNASEEASLGSEVDKNGRAATQHQKRASAESPYVGQRTDAVKPSDLALLRGLGLPT